MTKRTADQEATTMVTETDRNKARSAVVSVYNALDCVGMTVPFLHAFADAAVDAVSTDAEQAIMDDEDRTPMPAGFDDALWRKADEVHHAMALVARDQECVKIIYAALSTHNAEPVKTAPAVAVKDACAPDLLLYNLLMEAINEGVAKATDPDWTTKDFSKSPYYQDIHAALSAQVQGVAESKPLELNITKEWFEKRATLEGDHEIGAGSRKVTACIDPTPEELAELFRIAHRIPEGWQLVPKEPTEEMHNAARDWAVKKYGLGIGFDGSDGCYRAMISAAPASPASKHGDAE